jgi:hypothetical protein
MSRLSNNTCKNTTDLHVKSFVGNIIPHSWYHKITTSAGRPDRTAILILAEIVYWYRPCKVQANSGNMPQSKSSNNTTDKSRAGGFKFQCDALWTSCEYFERKFGYSAGTLCESYSCCFQLERSSLPLERPNLTSKKFRIQYIYPTVNVCPLNPDTVAKPIFSYKNLLSRMIEAFKTERGCHAI